MRPPVPYDGFWDWLEESMGPDDEPRRVVLTRCVRDGLIPFLKGHGYEIAVDSNTLKNWIANGVYSARNKSHVESDWHFPTPNTGWYPEDLWQFEHVLSDDTWESFWNSWADTWEDISLHSFRGLDRRLDIQALVWECIDIAKSEQTRILDEMLFDSEDEGQREGTSGAGRKTQDVYLTEAEGWGGYRR